MIPDNLTVKALAYDATLDPTLRGIDILKAGTLVIEDIEGNNATYVFSAFVAAGGEYTVFPYRLKLRIAKIIGDGSGSIGVAPNGTDITLANMVGLH